MTTTRSTLVWALPGGSLLPTLLAIIWVINFQKPLGLGTLKNGGKCIQRPLAMPKDDRQAGFDLNLALMEDEALIVLAKECEYGPARDELIVRYGSQADRLIGWLAHSYGFGHTDVEDARQNAVFWMVEAIKKYDTRQIGKPQGCSFRSFVHRVVIARFKDFAKHLRRVEHHYDRTARCSDDEDFAEDTDGELKDPATIVEARESMTRLHETLTCLDSDSGHMWRLLAEGNSLRQIAVQIGVSYDSAKRRRRKLIDELKLRLNSSRKSVDLN
jgi:RNA polymerase sigma factor (sigma-70 family)